MNRLTHTRKSLVDVLNGGTSRDELARQFAEEALPVRAQRAAGMAQLIVVPAAHRHGTRQRSRRGVAVFE